MSYKIYNDVIITGTLNGTISSSSFNWNRSEWYYENFQNNKNNTCFVLRGSGEGEYYLDKNSTSHPVNHLPYGTRLIIEFKE